MSAPRRIQLSRKKGFRLPPNTVSVARPSTWGNPWTVSGRFGRAEAVAMYAAWMDGTVNTTAAGNPPDPRELRGKNLACWCPLSAPCHADVLLEVANR